MRKKNILIFTLTILILATIFSYYFLYNAYGSEIIREPDSLYADPSSEITLKVIPINAMGFKAVFRKCSASFEVIEGRDLVDTIIEDEENGILKLRSGGKTGIVGIKIRSRFSFLPEYIEIEIRLLKA